MAVTVDGITVLLQPAISVFEDVSMIALQLSRESYVVFPSSTIIEVRALHPLYAVLSMFVTLLGIVIEVRALQYWKAFIPMFVTLLGMDTETRPLQLEKAPTPILTVPFRILMDVLAGIFPLYL
jgi:hypothetical protein